MTQPVVIAAGGTGGHVVPALAVAEVLRSRNVPVIWVGTRTGLEARLVPGHGIDIHWISIAGLRGKKLLTKLIGPLQLVRSCFQSIVLLLKIRPRAVLGMGGFVAGPVGIAACLMRKPLVLHEQNAIAGITNRYLRPLATRVFCAWPGAFGDNISAQAVGNPVRSDIAQLAGQARQVQKDSSQSLRVLIVGGSRGARALNTLLPAAIAGLRQPVTVTHQTGSADLQRVKALYEKAPLASVTVLEFIEDMAAAYLDTDLVICRSGAMTVTELSALGLPAILIPFPYAVDDHQTLNARFLSDHGAAWLLPEAELKESTITTLLERLADDRQELESMSRAARDCFSPDAAVTVADALLEVSD